MIESIREEMKLLGTLMGILWSGTSTILSLLMLSVLPSTLFFRMMVYLWRSYHFFFLLSEYYFFSKFVDVQIKFLDHKQILWTCMT